MECYQALGWAVIFFFEDCLGFNAVFDLPTKEGDNKGITSKEGAINCYHEKKNFFPNTMVHCPVECFCAKQVQLNCCSVNKMLLFCHVDLF